MVIDIEAILGSPVLVNEVEGPAETEHKVEEEVELALLLDSFKKDLPPGDQESKAGDITPIRLRSQPRLLSGFDIFRTVQQRGFSVPGKEFIGDFRHEYEKQQLSDAKVIVDKSTGLMWQQSGAASTMTFDQAKEYVARLNAEPFGGFSDWRLPTIEELASLVEPVQKHADLYIDPVFDDTQRWIRSADKESTKLVWGIVFYEGKLYRAGVKFPYYVRAVRSINAA